MRVPPTAAVTPGGATTAGLTGALVFRLLHAGSYLYAATSHGLYRRGKTVMHISPGLETTFLPFRFFARPEATELVLRCVRDGRA